MKLSTIFTYVLLIILIILLIIPSVYNVNKRHQQRLITATNNKITETALECYKKQICKDKKITLKELYAKNLLPKIANPLNKEYYNENSYVLISSKEIKFIEAKS